MGFEELVAEVPVSRDRGADVARVDRLAAIGQPSNPSRLEELREQLGLRRLLDCVLRERQLARDHHPLDQAVQLGQRLGRRIRDERLERQPLGLSLVPVHTGLDHAGEMPRRDGLKPGCLAEAASRLAA
jgi:hypothetical protein